MLTDEQRKEVENLADFGAADPQRFEFETSNAEAAVYFKEYMTQKHPQHSDYTVSVVPSQ